MFPNPCRHLIMYDTDIVSCNLNSGDIPQSYSSFFHGGSPTSCNFRLMKLIQKGMTNVSTVQIIIILLRSASNTSSHNDFAPLTINLFSTIRCTNIFHVSLYFHVKRDIIKVLFTVFPILMNPFPDWIMLPFNHLSYT